MLRRFVFMFAAVSNLLLLDQFVKEASIHFLKGQPPKVVINGFFNLTYVENRGCAWGMLQGQVWPLVVFSVIALAFLLWKRRSVFPAGRWGAVAETILYAGIIGNLIDRVYRGFVVDMFDFVFGSYHFPVFNVADSFITIAAAILIFTGFFVKSPSGKPGSKDAGRHGPA